MTQKLLEPAAKDRRDNLTAKGLCINGATHGAATHGRLCWWCREVHRRGVLAVLADPAGPPRPPGYQYHPREMRLSAPAVTPA